MGLSVVRVRPGAGVAGPGPSLTAGVGHDKAESKPIEIRPNIDQHQTWTLEEELLLSWPCDICTHEAPSQRRDSGVSRLCPLTRMSKASTGIITLG